MSNYIQLVKNEKSDVVIKIEPISPEAEWQDAGLKELAKQVEIDFDKVMETVNLAAAGFMKGLENLGKKVQPDEASLEFGLVVSSEVGIALAKAGSEALFKVSLTWKGK